MPDDLGHLDRIIENRLRSLQNQTVLIPVFRDIDPAKVFVKDDEPVASPELETIEVTVQPKVPKRTVWPYAPSEYRGKSFDQLPNNFLRWIIKQLKTDDARDESKIRFWLAAKRELESRGEPLVLEFKTASSPKYTCAICGGKRDIRDKFTYYDRIICRKCFSKLKDRGVTDIKNNSPKTAPMANNKVEDAPPKPTKHGIEL